MVNLTAEDLYAEQIHQARRQSPSEKIEAGIELFELACEFARAGIRMEHPDADEERVLAILRERMARARLLENPP